MDLKGEKNMIVFMGTPEFAVPILEMLIKEKYPVGLVVTQPDKAVGRRRELTMSPVKELALKHNIEVYQPVNIRKDYQYILDKKPDLIITAAYGQIMPGILFKEASAVNIHGSILPEYRGGAPIQYSLFNGDSKTGITLMEMIYKMDAGDIIDQSIIEIDDNDNYGTLSEKLSIVGRDLLKNRLPDLLNKKYKSYPQNEDEVSFAFTLKYEDEKLDFNQSATFNHNRVRGLTPNIGAHFYHNNTLIKVFKSNLNDIIDLKPNEIRIDKNRLFIGCSEGSLEITEIQQAGKRLMNVRDYLNGQTNFKNGEFINE